MVEFRRNWLVVAGALALAACSGRGDAPAEDEGATDEPAALTPVDTEEPAVEAPVLEPVSRAEIEAELEPGAGCSIEQDGKALLVAVDGDAIARPYGTMRHFTFDMPGPDDADGETDAENPPSQLDALYDGGTFRAGAITIAIEPEDGEGEQIGEVLVKRALITVSEENEGTGEIQAEWHCGA